MSECVCELRLDEARPRLGEDEEGERADDPASGTETARRAGCRLPRVTPTKLRAAVTQIGRGKNKNKKDASHSFPSFHPPTFCCLLGKILMIELGAKIQRMPDIKSPLITFSIAMNMLYQVPPPHPRVQYSFIGNEENQPLKSYCSAPNCSLYLVSSAVKLS